MPGGDYRDALRERAGWRPEPGPVVDADGSRRRQPRRVGGVHRRPAAGDRRRRGRAALRQPDRPADEHDPARPARGPRDPDRSAERCHVRRRRAAGGSARRVPGRGPDPPSRDAGAGDRPPGKRPRAAARRPLGRRDRHAGLGGGARPGGRALRRRRRPRRWPDRARGRGRGGLTAASAARPLTARTNAGGLQGRFRETVLYRPNSPAGGDAGRTSSPIDACPRATQGDPVDDRHAPACPSLDGANRSSHRRPRRGIRARPRDRRPADRPRGERRNRSHSGRPRRSRRSTSATWRRRRTARADVASLETGPREEEEVDVKAPGSQQAKRVPAAHVPTPAGLAVTGRGWRRRLRRADTSRPAPRGHRDLREHELLARSRRTWASASATGSSSRA